MDPAHHNNNNEESTTTTHMITLKPQEELRFEVASEENLTLLLKQGMAEIFGAELSVDRPYKFMAGTKLACFTYQGATIQLIIDHSNSKQSSGGSSSSFYTASETPMNQYMEVHMGLEDQRNKSVSAVNVASASVERNAAQQSLRDVVRGPRVMIVGPTDSGKSSLSKILLNYASRMGHKLMFVDLDVGQGQIAIPGVMAIAEVTEPVDILEEFNTSSAPIAFYYGHTTPSNNVKHYRMIVEHMAQVIKMKSAVRPEFASGGFIVNTCGWVEKLGYDLLKHAARSLQIDHILVMGDDKLSSSFKRDFESSSSPVNVTTLRKSGGVVIRSKDFRSKTRMRRTKEYFYGIRGTLSPHSVIVKFDDVVFCRIGSTTKAPASALPIGQKSSVDPCEVRIVEPSLQLKHNIVGVSFATKESDVLLKNLYGLVYVSNVDIDKREITLLSPSPGSLPSKYLVVGSLEWLDME